MLHNRVRFGDYETQADVSVTVPAPLDYDVQKAFWGEAEDGQLSWASWITYPADARPTPASLAYVDRIVELMRPDGTYVENSHDTTLSLLYNSLYVTTPDGTPLAYGTDFWVYAVSTADTPPPEQLAAANFEQILTGLAWKDIWEMEADEPLTLSLIHI